MVLNTPILVSYKLARNWLQSSLPGITLTVLLVFNAFSLLAHEIRPAIANITVSDDRVHLEMLVTLEALIADIDLAGLSDTNESPKSGRYDALRSESPEILERALGNAWPVIADNIRLNAGETRLSPVIDSVDIEPIGDIELARESLLRLSAPLPPDGSPITLGWNEGYGPLVVRQVLAEGGGYSGYLTGGQDSEPIPRIGSAQQPWLTAFVDYLTLGFEHIVPKGLDHILFVLGLFFFSLHLRPLLIQVTAFTVAHTVTLALGILGTIQIPASIVEPLIAASIVYVALENVLLTEYRPWRTLVVFCFGLLHGLGFASVLGDIGLDPARFVTGLFGFNIGVELGQLTVIAGAFLVVGLWFGKQEWYRRRIAVPASVAIGVVGAYWFVERVFL